MINDFEGATLWTEVSGFCFHVPIEEEQQDESGQVCFRNVRLLLEGNEDQHHHGGWNSVVQLKMTISLEEVILLVVCALKHWYITSVTIIFH